MLCKLCWKLLDCELTALFLSLTELFLFSKYELSGKLYWLFKEISLTDKISAGSPTPVVAKEETLAEYTRFDTDKSEILLSWLTSLLCTEKFL